MTQRTISINAGANITETPASFLWYVMVALNKLRTLTDELHDDHATFKTAVDELNTLTDELRADHATFITLTNELHVDVDLVAASLEGAYAKLDADAGVTDTDFVAVHGRSGSGAANQAAAIGASDVATITAAEATAGPATITAAKGDDFTTREVGTPS